MLETQFYFIKVMEWIFYGKIIVDSIFYKFENSSMIYLRYRVPISIIEG